MGKDPIHLFLCPKFSQRIHKNVLQQAHANIPLPYLRGMLWFTV